MRIDANLTHFVIWGISKGGKDETLLVEKIDGKYIYSLKLANKLASVLSKKYECKDVRVQKVNLRINDVALNFTNTINH